MKKPDILIVDDDEDIRTQMKWALDADYEIHLAEDREEAARLFGDLNPDLVLLDLGLPPSPGTPEEGLQALSAMLEMDRAVKVIIISGQSEKANALEAIGRGAYDFLHKPIEVDELKIILKRAYQVRQLERQYEALQQKVHTESFESMIGSSDPIQEIFAAILKVSTTDVPVLITGESGTGKEMAARGIHQKSVRRNGSFVAINCGAIPENLLESELFGHEKGSFTGAHARREGRIEAAQGGTLFLDEIGELPPSLQVKLLRFLQEQKIERIGGRESIDVNARIIAATNKNLAEAIKGDTFREDLYYRLAVVVMHMPPLRERVGDIPLLANAFIHKYVDEHSKKISGFSPQAIRAMERYEWPGNVRELENRVRRSVIMAEGPKVQVSDLELDGVGASYAGMDLKEAREALERDFVTRALARHKGNVSRAASYLGVSRPTLYEMMDKLGIERS